MTDGDKAGPDNCAASSILVLNCGSSSIKFALFDASRPELPRKPWWNGKVDGIGGAKPTFGATGAAAAIP